MCVCVCVCVCVCLQLISGIVHPTKSIPCAVSLSRFHLLIRFHLEPVQVQWDVEVGGHAKEEEESRVVMSFGGEAVGEGIVWERAPGQGKFYFGSLEGQDIEADNMRQGAGADVRLNFARGGREGQQDFG